MWKVKSVGNKWDFHIVWIWINKKLLIITNLWKCAAMELGSYYGLDLGLGVDVISLSFGSLKHNWNMRVCKIIGILFGLEYRFIVS